ncbi:ring-infected erythrocyte surface antigen domain-containing protein [Selenihalanaerobacter shriftii]|uniref:Uncharacterized protein n=1 Tax=Selenihalanaerobacter shriftii TaxID=142842 RepID=A0A1T4KX10_9FIRM|nr:hypothetical protein [Selenihalanaerobacter shriftii]SJZ46974.1 hypothetical protein SAMN02745118_00923 [Selenihalanaerobacter shriftii]
MKKYYVLVIIILILLVSLSTWARTPDLGSSSLFQANLKRKLITSVNKQFNLEISSELGAWLKNLNHQNKLVKERENLRSKKNDDNKFVKGITFYKSHEKLDSKVDLSANERVLIRKEVGLELAILPGVLMDSSYQMTKKEDLNVSMEPELEQELGLSIDYNLNKKLNLNAGYYLANEKSTFVTDNEDEWSNYKSNLEESMNENEVDNLEGEQTFTDNIQKIGIDYQTSDKTKIFADYLEEESASNDEFFTTAVGLEYNNNSEKITVQYQVENSDDMKSSSAGIELGLSDFAKLRAIYTMVDDTSTSGIQGTDGSDPNFKSDLLDLGLDLNVNEDTKVKLGYQLADEDDSKEDNLLDKFKPKAADVKLEIKF